MSNFLNKIPLIVYAIMVVAISIYLTHYLETYLISIDWISKDEEEARVGLYSSVLTVIGIFYAVMQLQFQRKDSLLANEYINQPEFEFRGFCSENLLKKGVSPGCCCTTDQVCTNNCNDEHWFDLKQIGNLPATNIKISMFHYNDSNNICCDKKIMKLETMNKNKTFQYKLPPYTFSEKLFDKNSNGSFFVLISYNSLYSNLKYKRIYELEYSPKPNANLTNGLWGDNIQFFSAELIKLTDYNSLRLRDILTGSLTYYLYLIKLKNTFNKDNWMLKY
jgi:hypothetical protein